MPTTATKFQAPAATTLPVDSPQRLTMNQAHKLFHLIVAFRPDWDDRAILSKIQETALYSPLTAPEIVSLVINDAATSERHFSDLEWP